MSGIYGIISRSGTISERMFAGLTAWNKAYGCNNCTDASDSGLRRNEEYSYRFGAHREFFKTCYADGSAMLFDNNQISVIDSLLYRRNEVTVLNSHFSCSSDQNELSEDRSSEPELLTDEEYIFRTIRVSGASGLTSINGDFAGAFLDTQNNRLILFRDHMGVRPLFYYCTDGLIAFSTDIRGITSIEEVDTAVNPHWLYSTLVDTPFLTTTETEYEHIFCVPPGGYITIDLTQNQFQCLPTYYWVPGRQKIRFDNEKEYISHLRELITDAVRIRLDAIDGNIGAELSGGLDSGIIDILISRLGRESLYFSWIPDENTVPVVENDERLIIYDICKQENISCHYGKLVYHFGPDSEIARQTPLKVSEAEARENYLIKYGIPVYINTPAICNTADYLHSLGARVIFTGHGGDEGVSHRCDPYELIYHHEYNAYLHLMWRRSYNHKFRVFTTLKNIALHLHKARKRFGKPFLGSHSASEILNPTFKKQCSCYPLEKLTFSYDPADYIRRGGSRSRLDVVALFGAYNQIRYIAPYVDFRLIDYSLGIPRYMYLSSYQNRFVFREAFKDIIPKSLYDLQSKLEVSLASFWDQKREEAEAAKKEAEEAARNKAGETAGKEAEGTVPQLSPDSDSDRILREERLEMVEKLNSAHWSKYLDFDFLNQWIENKQELEINDDQILFGLDICFLVENTVKKSREFV